ncbi:transcription factor Spi-C [Anarrhichthys ocellatus]|uniref:transcription factor Spi-C n=1 Tax=Anarrhichthys ocellatus TaxID=433405 RepID=UPI0012EDEA86|nr:transcription factor Spi-C-like [Anarrhichthys ocellatus]
MVVIVPNSFQETQSDLEVILEFLEEYYRQHSGGNVDKMYCTAVEPVDERSAPVDEGSCEQRWTCSGKVRLFHFLFEVLEDPNMAHCVSWVPAAAGVFRFSSTNKDQVAALWGQRKGNKRLMTYQKMSRALRNYARSGEIFKVKKKLTYQFSRETLMLLQKCQ